MKDFFSNPVTITGKLRSLFVGKHAIKKSGILIIMVRATGQKIISSPGEYLIQF